MTNIENDVAEILVSEKEIEEISERIAAEITNDFKDSPRKLVLLSILKGSLPFTADLMKKIKLPLELEFMKVSSYGSGTISSGELKITLDLAQEDLSDMDIVIVEDIVDTGFTLSTLVRHLKNRGAKTVRLCTLLNKPSRRTVHLEPDYIGKEIKDEFVIGYGLDYAEKYRNLPYVGILKPEIYLKS